MSIAATRLRPTICGKAVLVGDFMNTPHAPKRRFRFTIAGLLFLILCVAGTLAGYRVGFNQGYAGGDQKRQSEKPFAHVYPVADLVIPNGVDPSTAVADFDTLIQLITSTIRPDTWEEVGGPGSIEAFPTNSSLVINQTPDVHDKIQNLLGQMRNPSTLNSATE